MTVVYGIVIMMALLAGGAIGLLLTVARSHLVAARHQKYEQEVARDRELYAAAQAVLQHYKSTGFKERPGNPTVAASGCGATCAACGSRNLHAKASAGGEAQCSPLSRTRPWSAMDARLALSARTSDSSVTHQLPRR